MDCNIPTFSSSGIATHERKERVPKSHFLVMEWEKQGGNGFKQVDKIQQVNINNVQISLKYCHINAATEKLMWKNNELKHCPEQTPKFHWLKKIQNPLLKSE